MPPPKTTDQAIDLKTLKAAPSDAFAAQVHPLLVSLAGRIDRPHYGPFHEVIAITARATEPQTIAALEAAVIPPYADRKAFDVAVVAFDEILACLPTDVLESYRATLTLLAAKGSSKDPELSSSYKLGLYTDDEYLYRSSVSLLDFMDNPTAVWIPKHKFDSFAIRSLNERVTTAEAMQPHVTGLLGWLADGNWPPFFPCRQQLARFPEITVGPIASLIAQERGDGGWIRAVLDFLEEHVPEEMWPQVKGQLQELVEEPKGDENDWDVAELARDMLDRL
ncbi:hypothetical protein ABW21_db0204078 [Orbilia brochopaga]|nr:hypothetical protein ABW21_db0204078 [Drechslerella brochopaga]